MQNKVHCNLLRAKKGSPINMHFLLQGIFPTQGLNPCPLYWQKGSLPLSHQGSQEAP